MHTPHRIIQTWGFGSGGAEPAWAAGAEFPSAMGRSGILQEPSTASPALPRATLAGSVPGHPLSPPLEKCGNVEAAFPQVLCFAVSAPGAANGFI